MPGAGHETEARTLRILFFLGALNYDRVFEAFLRELLVRGHEISIVLRRRRIDLPDGAGEAFRSLAAEFGGRLRWETDEKEVSSRASLARELRRILDHLRYLEPEYADAPALRDRSREGIRRPALLVVDALARRRGGRRVLARVVGALERAVPVRPSLVDRIRRDRPDVVMVAPLIELGSLQADVLRAAAAAGAPAVFPVASWDNLTNKGLVRDVPDRTIVWNEDQVDEAVTLQRLPRDRVHAVGAHAYDHWFTWQPSEPYERFAEKVGLDAAQPYLLYACSSAFIAGDETVFVREWVERLRAAGGPLATIGVLVRPHPQNVEIWRNASLDDERVVVWPAGGEAPTDTRRKSDYFDSLHHSRGVVGINTSVLIEASIVRRPVFTVTTDRYRHTQSGTLHFGYLTDGTLNVAGTWEEHLEQLAHALVEPEPYLARAETFLRRFIRPHGLDRPAAPLAADVVERAAREGAARTPRRPAPAARAVIRLLLLAASAKRLVSAR